MLRGSTFILTFISFFASGGRSARKERTVFARGENGLKAAVTEVRKRVFMAKTALNSQ